MKNIYKIVFLTFTFMVFLLSGCKHKSSEADFLYLQGYENVEVVNQKLDLEVNYDVTSIDLENKIVVSDFATFSIFSDVDLRNRVTTYNLNIGENTYYIFVVSEDEKVTKVFEIDIYRYDRFDVTYNSGENFSITNVNGGNPLTTVDEGNDFSFALIIDAGYEALVYINDSKINEINGVYTYTSVHNDLNVTVVTSIKVLSITYPSAIEREGYVISSCTAQTLPTSISYGSVLCFRATIMDNYEVQSGGSFVVKNNGVIINETGTGTYVINNIISDVVISIDNSSVVREKVNLTYNTSEKYKLIDMSTGLEATSTLNKGTIATLSVFINEGYIGSVVVNLNSGSLIKTCAVGEECSVTIQNVVSDVNISIDETNLRKAEHSVTYSILGVGASITSYDLEELASKIEDGGTLNLYVSVVSEYKGEYTLLKI